MEQKPENLSGFVPSLLPEFSLAKKDEGAQLHPVGTDIFRLQTHFQAAGSAGLPYTVHTLPETDYQSDPSSESLVVGRILTFSSPQMEEIRMSTETRLQWFH